MQFEYKNTYKKKKLQPGSNRKFTERLESRYSYGLSFYPQVPQVFVQ